MEISAYVKKLDLTHTRVFEELPEASREYLANYGFTQCVNDAHASVQRKDYSDGAVGDAAWTADVKAATDARLAQIDSGDFARARKADPATAKIKAVFKKAGVDVDSIDPDKLLAWLKRQADAGRAA
jgi:hypothetical protein